MEPIGKEKGLTMTDESQFDVAREQLMQVNEARAAYYRMLASLFYRELSAEQIDRMRASDLGSDAPDGEREALKLMAGYLTRTGSNARQELAADYAHTFLAAGHYKEHMAIPYESVYTSEEGLLMQDARDDVYRTFRKEGIEVTTAMFEPEDHISFEMSFMAAMADRANEALEACDWETALHASAIAAEFRAEHLANWIDDFCNSVESVAQTKFYMGVSKLARSYVAGDAESLEDINELLQRIVLASREGAQQERPSQE